MGVRSRIRSRLDVVDCLHVPIVLTDAMSTPAKILYVNRVRGCWFSLMLVQVLQNVATVRVADSGRSPGMSSAARGPWSDTPRGQWRTRSWRCRTTDYSRRYRDSSSRDAAPGTVHPVARWSLVDPRSRSDNIATASHHVPDHRASPCTIHFVARTTLCPGKQSLQFSIHSFNKLKYIFIIRKRYESYRCST